MVYLPWLGDVGYLTTRLGGGGVGYWKDPKIEMLRVKFMYLFFYKKLLLVGNSETGPLQPPPPPPKLYRLFWQFKYRAK